MIRDSLADPGAGNTLAHRDDNTGAIDARHVPRTPVSLIAARQSPIPWIQPYSHIAYQNVARLCR
jgi:hypothetical protein